MLLALSLLTLILIPLSSWSALLFEHLKLPVMKKTAGKTGYSTDQEVLEQLAHYHPVPALIIKYRELTKIKNTYLDALYHVRTP